MYHIEDKVAAIKEIQRMLGVNQTGVYDNATKTEVRRIQSEFSIDQTQVVDYETFKAIQKKYYKRRTSVPNSDYLISPTFPYKENDMDSNVELINKALAPILREYEYEGVIPHGSFLGESTLIAANFLREIFGIPKSDKIDSEFVNRLLLERKGLELKRKTR